MHLLNEIVDRICIGPFIFQVDKLHSHCQVFRTVQLFPITYRPVVTIISPIHEPGRPKYDLTEVDSSDYVRPSISSYFIVRPNFQVGLFEDFFCNI